MPVEKDERPLLERLRDYKLEPKGEALCREAAEEIDRLRDAARWAQHWFSENRGTKIAIIEEALKPRGSADNG